MPVPERTRRLVCEWVMKAEEDFHSAVGLLKQGDVMTMNSICFHAQQCVEKYLKARLVLAGIDFPRTHNIGTIVALLPPHARPPITENDQNFLTVYAVQTRYPGGYDSSGLVEARVAVRIARRVRVFLRKSLPRDCIPRKTRTNVRKR